MIVFVLYSSINLPPKLLRRVNALKNIQKSTTEIEASFYKEVQQLEAKYHKLYQPFYDQRKDIVAGTYEPTDAECRFSEDDNDPGIFLMYSGPLHSALHGNGTCIANVLCLQRRSHLRMRRQ